MKLSHLSFSFAALVVVHVAACGRSTLDSYPPELDAGSDANTPVVECGPDTCPTGCCDARGECRVGTARDACGPFGGECSDCPREGFPLCDPTSRTCARTVETCDETTCADGCCGTVNGNPICLRGNQPGACGKAGAACQDCGDVGLRCNAETGVCEGQPCNQETCADGCCLGNECLTGLADTTCGGGGLECENCQATGRTCIADPRGEPGGVCSGAASCTPDNCSGCCLGDVCLPGGDVTACGGGAAVCDVCDSNETCENGRCVGTSSCAENCPGGCCLGEQCLPGTDVTACGLGGLECQNCAGTGDVCVAQQCAPVACNAETCPNGCCDGDVCRVDDDAACGSLGGQCSNCAKEGQVCEVGACVTPCSADNCVGCCDGNLCVAGFLNDACGSNGAACADCTAQNNACDVDALPRGCVDNSDCPAAYPSCPNGTTTQVLQRRDACSEALLAQAASACSGGPNTAGCRNFFQQIAGTPSGAACGECMAPFRYTLASFRGVANCAAAFVNASCNRATGCSFDCEDDSCTACDAGGAGACRQNVRQGQCGEYFQRGLLCLAPALIVGDGSFCRPDQYNGYGDWLSSVGGFYCAP